MKKQINVLIPFIFYLFSISCTQATPVAYELVEDDYNMVGDGKYDNFSIYSELDAIWARHKIAYILEKHFENPSEGDRVEVTYDYYNGQKQTTQEIFKQENNTWQSEAGTHEIPMLETSAEGLKVITWNLEWFGAADDKSKSTDSNEWHLRAVAAQFLRMNADFYALQEVVVDGIKGDNLQVLIDALNANSDSEWDGFYSSRHSYSWNGDDPKYPAQKVAFIYKKDRVTLKKEYTLFEENYTSNSDYDLPGYTGTPSSFMSSGRLPYIMEAEVELGGKTQKLVLVNIHLKCCDAADRRKADAKYLYDRLQEDYPNDNVIILGDYNNATYNGSEAPEKWGWYDEGAYFYAGGQDDGIDHLSISDELLDEFMTIQEPYYTEYEIGGISDHNPHLLILATGESDKAFASFSVSHTVGNETEESEIKCIVSLQSAAKEDIEFAFGVGGNKYTKDDCTLSKESFMIKEGAIADTILLTVNRDAEVEDSEVWTVSTSSDNAIFNGATSQKITIHDLPSVSVSLSDTDWNIKNEELLNLTLKASQDVDANLDFVVEIPQLESLGLSLEKNTVSIARGKNQANLELRISEGEITEGTVLDVKVNPVSDLQYMEGTTNFEVTIVEGITFSDKKDIHDFQFIIKNQQLVITSLSEARHLLQLAIFHIDAQKVLEKTIDVLPKQEVILTEGNLNDNQIYIIRYEQDGVVKSLKIKA